MSGRTRTRCPACGSGRIADVLSIDRIPVFCNVLHDSAEAARTAAMGTMDLVACAACGLLFNAAFDPELVTYAAGYENSLHFSPAFQRYADGLAKRLAEQYGVSDGHIVEVGSGSGEFLEQICQLSGSRGTGFDPSFDPATSVAPASGRLTVMAEPFTAGAVEEADLVLARHVLEHVEDPRALLTDIRSGATAVAGDPPVVYIEVPDATYMLEHTAVWDLIYEHHTYWSAAALEQLLAASGFRVVSQGRAFGDQFLWVDAVPTSNGDAALGMSQDQRSATFARTFEARFTSEVMRWRTRMHDLDRHATVVIWGAGSKGVTFANVVGIDPSASRVVDISPRKHGRHVPGTGHTILRPEDLRGADPVHVLVMNGMYEDEVRASVGDLGLEATMIEVV